MTTDYVKINFFLSVLQRCEQSVVLNIIKKLKEASSSRAVRDGTCAEVNISGDDNEFEIVYDETSSDDDEESVSRRFIRQDEHGNTCVDFIRFVLFHRWVQIKRN